MLCISVNLANNKPLIIQYSNSIWIHNIELLHVLHLNTLLKILYMKDMLLRLFNLNPIGYNKIYTEIKIDKKKDQSNLNKTQIITMPLDIKNLLKNIWRWEEQYNTIEITVSLLKRMKILLELCLQKYQLHIKLTQNKNINDLQE